MVLFDAAKISWFRVNSMTQDWKTAATNKKQTKKAASYISHDA